MTLKEEMKSASVILKTDEFNNTNEMVYLEDAIRIAEHHSNSGGNDSYSENAGSPFAKYKRTNIAEMRYYIKGEDLSNVSVSDQDDPDSDMGMIARNPNNHKDQWYVARKYFEENFEAI